MKIADAIKYLEDFDELCGSLTSEGPKRFLDAIGTALDALKENLNRSKGCPVCNDGAVLGWDMCNDGIYIDTDGKMQFLNGGDWDFQIAYCPKCGRVLSEKPIEIPEFPLTLDELREYVSAEEPNDTAPLYVVFNPEIPLDYAPRWRDVYNLSSLLEVNADGYGKEWTAYRHKPNNN